jgi:hypothetical protein
MYVRAPVCGRCSFSCLCWGRELLCVLCIWHWRIFLFVLLALWGKIYVGFDRYHCSAKGHVSLLGSDFFKHVLFYYWFWTQYLRRCSWTILFCFWPHTGCKWMWPTFIVFRVVCPFYVTLSSPGFFYFVFGSLGGDVRFLSLYWVLYSICLIVLISFVYIKFALNICYINCD